MVMKFDLRSSRNVVHESELGQRRSYPHHEDRPYSDPWLEGEACGESLHVFFG